MKKRLKPFQEKFVHLYHKTNNATRSYMEAYGNDNYMTSAKAAQNLLKHPLVQKELRRLQDQVIRKYKVTKEDLIRVAVDQAFSKLSDVAYIDEGGEIKLKFDPDDPENIDNLDSFSFSKSESHHSSDKGDSSSKSISIAAKRKDNMKGVEQLAKLIGAYEGNTDSDIDKRKDHAKKMLEVLKKFKKKDE